MIAIDTNVVVRLLAADDPLQSELAKTFVNSNRVFVPKTVILECEWVLRSTYRLSSDEICGRLGAFLGLPTVTVEDDYAVADAIALYADGFDFADALHLQSSIDCEALVTFDHSFAKKAAHSGRKEVRLLT